MVSSETPTKRERSVDLAEKWASKAIKAVMRLAALPDSARFELTRDELENVVQSVEAELEKVRMRMSISNRLEDVTFKL